MPAGTYTIVDAGARIGTEAFRSAPGPMGWRYVSEIETTVPTLHRETVDLIADATWRPVRMRVETGEHSVLLERDGERLTGFRDGEPLDLALPADRELDYQSPAFNVVTAMRYGRTVEFEVWFFDPVTIEPRSMRQRYEHRGEDTVDTSVGRFAAIRWGYEAVDTGYVAEFWTADDVVVRYTNYLELERYEPGATGAPTLA